MSTLCENRVIGKCGRCETCLWNRRWQWQQRIAEELTTAPRTWFCTFTFGQAPTSRRDVSRSVCLYMKRLRKAATRKEIPIRYFVVVEKGSKHGRLHAHALIHSRNALSYRLLLKPWTHGHSNASLVGNGKDQVHPVASLYITKYITKESGRVYASRRYGYLNPHSESKSLTVKAETFASFLSGKIMSYEQLRSQCDAALTGP